MLQFLLCRRRNWGEVIICRESQLPMGKCSGARRDAHCHCDSDLISFVLLRGTWAALGGVIGFTKQECCTPSLPQEKSLRVQQKYCLHLTIQLYLSFVPVVTLSSQGYQHLPMGHILSLCRCFQKSWFFFTARRTSNFKSKRKYWIT